MPPHSKKPRISTGDAKGPTTEVPSSSKSNYSKPMEIVEGQHDQNPEEIVHTVQKKSRWDDDDDELETTKPKKSKKSLDTPIKALEEPSVVEDAPLIAPLGDNVMEVETNQKSRWEVEEEIKKEEIVIEKEPLPEVIETKAMKIEPTAPEPVKEVVKEPTEKPLAPVEPPPPETKKMDTFVKKETKEDVSLLLQAGLHSCRSVGVFDKICRIGDGAYGVVYKAKDKKTGEFIALKKVKMEKEKEGFPLTSIREIRILMSCKHNNIVAVKEIVVGKEIDAIFIAMEYLEHDLKTLMEDMTKQFTIAEVKCIMNQLLLGVEYLHDNWILHRDIKTSNLLLNNNGIMKIADFGLARPYGSPLRPYTHVVVTLWYRSPELLLGTKTYTPAIDIWSVGCVFAELLLSKPLFRGKGEIDQLDQIFKILGPVDEEEWPEYTLLPNTKKFVNIPRKGSSNLKQAFKAGRLSDKGLDLLQKMLTYNPAKRITAGEALQHPYFEESPIQKDPDLMPTYPSRADGRKPRQTDVIIANSSNPQLDGEREKERETFIAQRDRNYSVFK
eukprot:TRINITY_DN12256_c0_g1_i10.p1 TRINITY_DN12256_c0_g1~~TRINITY_DN12256_c0_g1_i10.p1  ORF type:complete len:555 (+),score=179.45 TRINITY_DN12256_c0_g1_i10:1165-2829(+)